MEKFTKPFDAVSSAQDAASKLGCKESDVKLMVVIENQTIVNLAWTRHKKHYILVLNQTVGNDAKFIPFKGDQHEVEPYFLLQGHFCYYDKKEKTLREISVITDRKLASERAALSGVFDDAPIVGKIHLPSGKHKGQFIYVWFAKQDRVNNSVILPVFAEEDEYLPSSNESLKLLREGQEVMSLDGKTSLHMIYMIPTGCRLI